LAALVFAGAAALAWLGLRDREDLAAASDSRRAAIKPPPLAAGAAIALVAPAGPVEDAKVKEASANLARLGYRVKHYRSLSAQEGYLAGSDEARAFEIDRAFADPEVGMILCLRGGYGSPRILGLLDYEAMRRRPKIFVGYSDVTALHLAILRKAGLVTFHGPMAERDFSGKGLAPYSSKYFWSLLRAPGAEARALFEAWGAGAPPASGSVRAISPGAAEGPLVGGNLSTICALLGTPYEIETDGAILFIEDVNEEPFRIDRMLCQLRLAGKLGGLEGALLGGFTRCEARTTRPSFTVEDVLDQYFSELGIPVLAGFPAGHLADQATLPLGVRVRLDATRKTLRILEPAVAN
jgi:muramoyltetrapeptide carboxypeptidase